MTWTANSLGWLLARTRPQFHPAVIATWQVAYWGTFLIVLMSPLLWLISQFGDERFYVDYELLSVFAAVGTVSELVRGNVRAWLGDEPGDWNYVAIGIAGAVAGAVFATFLWLKWGDQDLNSFALTTGIGALLWLALGFLMQLQERQARKKAAMQPPLES